MKSMRKVLHNISKKFVTFIEYIESRVDSGVSSWLLKVNIDEN